MISAESRLQRELAEKNKPSTASTSQSCFRTVNRQKFPGWASRYAKGSIYDLDYDVRYENIKGKGQLLHRKRATTTDRGSSERNRRIENLQGWIPPNVKQSVPKEPETEGASQEVIDSGRYKQIIIDRIEPSVSNQAAPRPKQLENYEPIDRHTIDFNIRSKSSHHLRFEKQPSRKENVLNVLYDTGLQLKADPLRPNFKYVPAYCRTQRSVHQFQSYQQHSVFVPLPETDLTYDWTQPEKKLRLRSATSVNFKLMTRKSAIKSDAYQPQPFTRLDYNLEAVNKFSKTRIPSCKIDRAIERKLVFSRQVILPERGCSR